ncbi:amino acid ABC transporter permease/ATP-binding protein [Mesorhizobium sp. WSM4307]|uniref:amino acid ABC transporter permease/ATP-binding protein n=1 Tax=unclassified Mesorhizobium TaxID=325217 RepID=UPI000BB06E6F|nr:MULTISPECIES: amino acid ABC transporter permease/ATP-binding protein [unclassified Mesorhizobium]PBB24533.1 ABC transporter ATP-binding protein [Mesorhizobium sp. WSM4304]PBB74792.1 ABC transporter ATP-binding protein [Mesorhizobium sp. WSM4308]TRC71643.1 amino acid ABC transporter permease/ATP-binding protein [Mesorhizobium sp. WSM4315]TRC83447.1 amino acid ABC transporter permease/ATP-binding protein [Mesorhizobium sp. WSM4307]
MTMTADIGEVASPRNVPFTSDRQGYRVVPAKHPWRVVGTVVAVVVIFFTLQSIMTNPRWGWDVFARFFLSEPVLVGLGRTLLLTVLASGLGFFLGTLLAFARVSASPLLSGVSWAYIWLLRSIPLIVLLLVLNNLGYLYPTINVGVPFTGLLFAQYNTVEVFSPFWVAVVGLSLNQAAFSAEIIRGGILSVDQGQHEAAAALGLSRRRQALGIVLPQAMRAILPSGFNEIIGLAKSTSMVYVLALPELFYTVQVIYKRNLEVIPLLMVATIWYLIIMSVLSIIQLGIERRFSRGAVRTPSGPLLPSLFAFLSGRRSVRVATPAPFVPPPSTAVRKPLVTAGEKLARQGVGRIAIRDVSKSFGALTVLDGVDLDLAPGSVTAIIGPSGAGKSTLLRTINHLERTDTGFVTIDDELVGYHRDGHTLYELKEAAIRQRRAAIGMVFQNFNLFPHLTVIENIIEAPVSVQGVARAEAIALAKDLLTRIGLPEKADAYPRHLSGGQQQRVAIARALALKPKVLLFDEPTSALDPELVGEVLDVIKELATSGTTMVIVTHEIGFAREVADTIVFMEGGKILEVGTPSSVFTTPAHQRTREFLAKVL